ncbi:MAG TPA: ubiquinol-cytochrome c reductase cytochrome b subunit [Candidatus Avipropionibacterium avicola]|uniref:Cytochrome bc1 complex cytochrome b subunit n=1 Tax=Candidatus Avipropionibacterium avicola TaxID=2840701 RepID=A0A9D1KL05_9ACTN|nr:ubiquinol-cytochrome c reductase cytochrome b subunit [Candidatus Avipropionibacterium avicola]
MARPVSTDSPVAEETATANRPEQMGPVFKAAAGPARWADERLGIAGLARSNLRKVFPDHWSFLLGEIALYSFIICLLSGVFLTLWFRPSMAEIEYEGTYQLLRGLPMSEAYASTIELSFDIRGGLLMRQIHHWGALLFIAAMFAHMLRVFFTGAFRKPRELNWLLGVGLIAIGMIEGFAGYSLPDDLLSGTGLRFVDGLVRSIPIVGTWLEFLVFGGEFPGDIIVARLYIAHVLLIPGIILGLIAAHLALVVYHKHTQFPGPGRTEKNVVGYPLFPVYMAKAGGFFFIVFGAVILMSATMQINPVWKYGAYNPEQVTAGSQPDWYMGWVEGAVRIMPGWEWHIGGTTWSWNVFLPAVMLMGLLFTVMGVYPFIEQWVTKDKDEHHLLERPRNNPTRTAFGVAAMSCYAMFWLGGGNDIIATMFHVSLNAVTYFLRVAVFVVPVIAFLITKRICISLQRYDIDRLTHGAESGVIDRSPDGGYAERHVPVSDEEAFTLTSHIPRRPLELEAAEDEDGVSTGKGGLKERMRAKASSFYYGDQPEKLTSEELAEAKSHILEHNPHAELEAGPSANGAADGDADADADESSTGAGAKH